MIFRPLMLLVVAFGWMYFKGVSPVINTPAALIILAVYLFFK